MTGTLKNNLSGLRPEAFQKTIKGKQTGLFFLRNKNGMEIALTNYGGATLAIMTPDKNGKFGNVILGHDSIDHVINSPEPFLSTTIGRYGNRIAKGKFTLGGKLYSLAVNNGPNALHGGPTGFHTAVWDVVKSDDSVLALTYTAADGEEGFPGKLVVNMWLEKWGGLPSEKFLTALDPLLEGFRARLYKDTFTSDAKVGYLTPEWAKRLGLTTNVAVGVGAFDCHMGAVGAEAVPNTLVRVIGTSTCDILVSSYQEIGDKLIKGICGQVDGSVIPGYMGLEAGQSAFGDVYAWFKHVLAWPIVELVGKTKLIDDETKQKLVNEALDKIIPKLSDQAAEIDPKESSVLATDWMNGRRTPDASQLVQGSITGLTLGSTAPMIFRALVEATAFGSKAIVDRFTQEGVRIESVIGIGGISLKSPFVMQTMADVLNMPIKVARSEQACAFGAAMFAAVVAGVYDKVEDAQKTMGQGFANEYKPDPRMVAFYSEAYKKYALLGQLTEDNFFKTI